MIDIFSTTTQNLLGLLFGIFSLSKVGSSKPDEHNVNLTINNHAPAVTSNLVNTSRFNVNKKDFLLVASGLMTIYIFRYINEIKELLIQLDDEELWCNWLNKTYRKIDDVDCKNLLQDILDEAQYKIGDRCTTKIVAQLKHELALIKTAKQKIKVVQKYLPSFFADSCNGLEQKNLQTKKLLKTISKMFA
jgi:hypothetical protein